MSPIAADGRIQVQDPCAAQSSVLTYYNQPSLYQSWQIYNDVNHNSPSPLSLPVRTAR